MRGKFQKFMYELSYFAEIFISIFIYGLIAIEMCKIVAELFNPALSWYSPEMLTGYLNRLLSLAVATEFVKMLCRHSASSVIEVLLFATARQMIVEHYSPLDTLLGVAAIAGLFAARKFLLNKEELGRKNSQADDAEALD